MREVHIWLDKAGFEKYENEFYLCKTYAETMVMLRSEQEQIHTTQTHFCQFEYGRIFVHADGEIHEITVGECEGTDREIKPAYNIEKMLYAGEFSWF